MSTMASQITSLTIVYASVYSGTDQRKHQSSASLAFVRGIHRGPVNSPHKGPVTRKMFPFDDVIMCVKWKCFKWTPLWTPYEQRFMDDTYVCSNYQDDWDPFTKMNVYSKDQNGFRSKYFITSFYKHKYVMMHVKLAEQASTLDWCNCCGGGAENDGFNATLIRN